MLAAGKLPPEEAAVLDEVCEVAGDGLTRQRAGGANGEGGEAHDQRHAEDGSEMGRGGRRRPVSNSAVTG